MAAFLDALRRPDPRGGTIRLDGDAVVVTPDSFGRTIAFSLPAREIADRPLQSDAELHAALRAAPVVTLHGRIGS